MDHTYFPPGWEPDDPDPREVRAEEQGEADAEADREPSDWFCETDRESRFYHEGYARVMADRRHGLELQRVQGAD